ncbi:unnamed protein product [Rotaria sp. Silwood2]|nr:unnamed protein product [Rotaria sp. Silwood2]
MRPKIWGAWNLHQATDTTHSPIHFFLLFSSLRNHSLAQLGASAYNAGNQYLESLAHWQYNYLQQPALAVSLPDHLQSTVLEDLVKRKYVQLEQKDEDQELNASVNTINIETIISQIRSAVAQIFGSLNVDHIDIQKSLNQQGMDSLMAVALRNWIEKELLISIPLSELFQEITIQHLSQTILTKLNKGLAISKPLTSITD